MESNLMKKSILLFSLIAVLISCKSDDTNPEDFQLNTETLSVIPYQLVKISSNSNYFSHEEYLADFGLNQIPMVKNNAGDLIFLVPDVPPGDYEFVLTFEGRKGVLNFYVGNNDPVIETTVFERAIEPLTFFQEYSTGLMVQYNLSQQTVDRLNTSNEMLTDLISQYHSSPAVEKEIIAKFLNANSIFTESYGPKHFNTYRATGENLPFIVNAYTLMNLSELFYSWNALLTPAIVHSQTIVTDDIIKVFTVAGIYTFSAQIEASIEALRDFTYFPVSVNIYDENTNSNNFNFQNNAFYSFELKLGERRLISDDINSSGTFVSEIVSLIDFIISNWEDFKVINPTVTNTTNWFSDWLSPNSNYIGISPTVAPLRQSDTVIENDGKSENMVLERIPNDINFEVQITGENTFDLRFIAEQNTLPRSFQFNVNYEVIPFQKMSSDINSTLE